MILVIGEPGTGKSVLLQQLMYSCLKNSGEPCVFLTFEGPPIAVEQDMQSLGWDLKPYIDRGLFRFVDCFSFRMEPVDLPDYVTPIKDPKDLVQITSILVRIMEQMKMIGRGAVFIDSLTEMFTLVQETRPLIYTMLEGIKAWRAKGPKERLVPFFCLHHTGLKAYSDMEDLLFYSTDGIFDLRFHPGFAERGLLVRQFRVRKLKGAPHETFWTTFSIGSQGLEEIQLPPPSLGEVSLVPSVVKEDETKPIRKREAARRVQEASAHS